MVSNGTTDAKTETANPKWVLRLFGGMRLESADARIDKFPTRRSALILARLALSRLRRASRDDLAEALWPDDFLDATRIRLRQELRRLRESLGDLEEAVDADRTWVRLREDLLDVDVWAFDRLVQQSKQAKDPAERVRLLSEALRWNDGTLVPESSEEWIDLERETYARRRVAALSDLAAALAETGEVARAIETAETASSLDPLNEDALLSVIRAHRAAGDASAAKRTYLEFESRLTRQLGISPSDALRQLAMAPLESERRVAPALPVVPIDVWTTPPKPDRTYGREAERRVLTGWLAPGGPARIVTLTGPGGVGKSHLSLLLADLLQSDFEGRIAFAEMASEEQATVWQAVRRSFGKSGEPVGPPASELAEAIGDRPALLVIDNAEHLVDEVRDVVKALMERIATLQVLVTSRKRLDLQAEREFPLVPLPIPEPKPEIDHVASVGLFLEHARRRKNEYDLDAEGSIYLSMLLKRLEGLPLAVQMAAQQVDALSLREIFEGLDDSFTHLIQRDPTANRRHYSLQSAFDWSYELLEPEEQRALVRLAAFAGGWTLETAAAALDDPSPLDLVRRLLRSSLLYVREGESGTRYGMLESVRQFAILAGGEAAAAEAQGKFAQVIGDRVFKLSRQHHGDTFETSYRQIGDEAANAFNALEWAMEHDDELVVKLIMGLWRYWCNRGDTPDGHRRIKRAVPILERSPATKELGEAWFGVGAVGRNLRDGHLADLGLRNSMKVFQEVELPTAAAWAQYNYAGFLGDLRRFKESLEHAQESRRIIESYVEEPHRKFHTVIARGIESYARAFLGDMDGAIAMMEQVFADRLEGGHLEEVAKAYGELAGIYVMAGRPQAAVPLYRTGIRHLRDISIQNWLLHTILALADVTPDAAERKALLDEAEPIARRVDDTEGIMEVLRIRGRYETDPKVARRCFAEALERAQRRDDPAIALGLFTEVALYLARNGDPGRARALMDMVARERKVVKVPLMPSERAAEAEANANIPTDVEESDWTFLLRAMPWSAACALISSFFRVESE